MADPIARADAERIVDAIIIDLSDRRGLRQALEGCDRDIRLEIREAWIHAVMTGGNENTHRPWWLNEVSDG